MRLGYVQKAELWHAPSIRPRPCTTLLQSKVRTCHLGGGLVPTPLYPLLPEIFRDIGIFWSAATGHTRVCVYFIPCCQEASEHVLNTDFQIIQSSRVSFPPAYHSGQFLFLSSPSPASFIRLPSVLRVEGAPTPRATGFIDPLSQQ